MSWCWGHRGEQHKRLFRELSLPRASWCGWRRTLELLQPSPGWVSPPVAARESVPSEGGRELSLQDGSARPTAALAGRRQACGRRERQGAGARLGVPDGGGRRGWGRGDRGTLWLQIRGGGESGRDEGLLIAFFDSSYVLSRLTRQFTSSPLTCEFFGDSHHQIPLM